MCAFGDSWTQPACFLATWDTCSTSHCKTPAQLDDARCQTGVSRGGTPASPKHPTICLKPPWHSICRKRNENGVAPHIRDRRHRIKQNRITQRKNFNCIWTHLPSVDGLERRQISIVSYMHVYCDSTETKQPGSFHSTILSIPLRWPFGPVNLSPGNRDSLSSTATPLRTCS